jgi:hypothetical protein
MFSPSVEQAVLPVPAQRPITGSTRGDRNVLLITVLKSNLDEWNDIRIVLLLAFKLNQIVVSAARGDGKLTANKRPRVIDGAFARFLIQEHTGLSKQPVSFASEYSFFPKDLGKSLRRDLG